MFPLKECYMEEDHFGFGYSSSASYIHKKNDKHSERNTFGINTVSRKENEKDKEKNRRKTIKKRIRNAQLDKDGLNLYYAPASMPKNKGSKSPFLKDFFKSFFHL